MNRNSHPLFTKLTSRLEALPDAADSASTAAILVKPLWLLIAARNICTLPGDEIFDSQYKISAAAADMMDCGLHWSLASATVTMLCVNRGRENPAADLHFFPFIRPEMYWTCERSFDRAAVSWGVNFVDGSSQKQMRSRSGYGLAVHELSKDGAARIAASISMLNL